MSSRRFSLRQQKLYVLLLVILSFIVTLVVFDFSAAQKSAKLPPGTALLSTPQPSPAPDPLKLKLSALHRLYQAVASITVENLDAQFADHAEGQAMVLSYTDGLEEPPQYRVNIHSTNFGDRQPRDINQRPVRNDLLVVLHETTDSVTSALHTMLGNHPRDQDQVSYHALIDRDGTIIYTVDPRKRAYGAGDSAYTGAKGVETVKTSKLLPPSVNNFAYHISLETPVDGMSNQAPVHSGYSNAQYQSLAWLVNQTGLSRDRIVTHAEIDQSGERQDPRSFDQDFLSANLSVEQYRHPDYS